MSTDTAVTPNRVDEFLSLQKLCPSRPPESRRLFVPRTSAQIAASKINLGMECLDRDMWEFDRTLKALGETGVKWARIQTGWSRCEKTAGVFDFAWLDDVVDRILEKGIQPWFNVTYGNMLHSGAPTPDAVGWAPVYSIGAKKAWVRFVGELTRHFRDRIDRYEVWNEPDIPVFWKHEAPNPLKYAELVAMTAGAIKRHHPNAFIIGGALSAGTGPAGLQFFERAFQAGMGKHLSAISCHTYRPRPEGSQVGEIRALRAMLQRHGLDLEIWQGEAGCPSVDSVGEAMAGIPWSEGKQAKWLLRRMLCDLDRDFDQSTHFHLSDFHNYFKDGPRHKPAHFGLLRLGTYAPKPAYHAFQTVCHLFDAQTRIDRELTAAVSMVEKASPGMEPKDWLLTQTVPFARKGRPLLAYWYPAELSPEIHGKMPFETGRIALTVTHPLGLSWENPVLIHPVTHEVMAVEAERRPFHFTGDTNPQWVFRDLPLLDHPLILTDAAAV